MSTAPRDGLPASAFPARITVPEILKRKTSRDSSGQPQSKIVCLTAYDYPTARALDEAGIDILLVGDSLGMAVLGYESTLPVTVEDILFCSRAVVRGTSRALVVADMPFGSYQINAEDAMREAVRLIKEGGVAAVKVEGG